MKRIDNLDLMKTIAIAMVLMLHTSLWDIDFISYPSRSRMIQYAFRMISEGVPIFVFVNGFLLFKKDGINLQKHYLKIIKIIILTLVWGCILTLVGLRTRAPQEPITIRTVMHYILTIQVGTPYTGFLWFLQNLVGIYLLFPMMKIVYDKSFKLFQTLFCIVAFFTVGVNVLQVIGEFVENETMDIAFGDILFFINRYKPIGNDWYSFYFMLGAMVMHYMEKIAKHKKTIITCGILAWGVNIAVSLYLSKKTMSVYDGALFYRTTFFIFMLAIFAITMPYQNHGKIIGNIVASIGQNTMGIYLLHTAIINIVVSYWWPGTFIGRVFFYVIVFCASYAGGILFRKIPIVRYIFEI